MVAAQQPTLDHINGNWRQRIRARLVAHVAETQHYSKGHEFGCQVAVLFLQSPLSSSCVVSERVQDIVTG